MTLKSDLFLASLLAVLGWIALELSSISKSLGIVVYRLDEHQVRIESVEKQCQECLMYCPKGK
jgi:hypothetical protein